MNHLFKKSVIAFSLIVAGGLCSNTYAHESVGKVSCTLTDTMTNDKQPAKAMDSFTKTTPNIYLTCTSDTIKKGQTMKAVWFADNTKNAAPDNYKIDEKSIDITAVPPASQTFSAHFSLTKPYDGWPLGSYHVEFYVDSQLNQSIKFSVQ